MGFNDNALRDDEWNEAQYAFQVAVCCPYCSTPLARENSHHLTRCSNCKGLLEWVLHQGEANLYWPRTINDDFSSFDGRRYNHYSYFDNAELGGDHGKTSGNLEPDLAIWNMPTSQETFTFKNIWSRSDLLKKKLDEQEIVYSKYKAAEASLSPGDRERYVLEQNKYDELRIAYERLLKKEEKFKLPSRIHPQSLLVMHGDLLVSRNDGAITTFRNIAGEIDEVKRFDFPSLFADNRLNDANFRYRPCGRFPHVFVSNEKECIIWRYETGTSGASHEKFTLPKEILNKSCYMLGSPTTFSEGNRSAFVMTLISKNASDGSYICAFVQDQASAAFKMVILHLTYRLDHAMLFSQTRSSLISLLLEGGRFLEVSTSYFWDKSNFEEQGVEGKNYFYGIIKKSHWFTSYLGYQYIFNQYSYMCIQSRGNDEFLILAFESSNNSDLYLAKIKLSSLAHLSSDSWSIVRIQGDINGPIQSISVGSCKGSLRAGQALLDTVALTVQTGIALIDLTSGHSSGTFISDSANMTNSTDKDPAIITNAGVVAKVGGLLNLSWEMLEWGAAGQRILRYPLKSAYMTGLTILNNRIFITRFSTKEDNGIRIFKVDAIDINKIKRENELYSNKPTTSMGV